MTFASGLSKCDLVGVLSLSTSNSVECVDETELSHTSATARTQVKCAYDRDAPESVDAKELLIEDADRDDGASAAALDLCVAALTVCRG